MFFRVLIREVVSFMIRKNLEVQSLTPRCSRVSATAVQERLQPPVSGYRLMYLCVAPAADKGGLKSVAEVTVPGKIKCED